jgi:hypothetical protein
MEVVSDDDYFLTGAKDLNRANGDNGEGNSLLSPCLRLVTACSINVLEWMGPRSNSRERVEYASSRVGAA